MTAAVRPYHPDDGPAYLAIVNQQRETPLTLEQLRRQESRRDAARFQQCLVALAGEDIVGYGLLESHVLIPAGWLRCEAVVARAHRGQGHGRRLAAAMEEVVRQRAPGGLEAWVRDDDPGSRAWAERRGFTLHTRRFDAVLDLAATGPAGRPAPAPPAGIRFFTLAEVSEPDPWERLHALSAHLIAETPDLEGQPPMAFADFCRVTRDNPRVSPGSIFVGEADGRWVAVSILFRMSGEEIYTFFTGVEAAYRGRGIARALKQLTIDHARAAGVRRMRTDVDARNTPMWAVNEALGYRPAGGIWRMHRARAAAPAGSA